MLSNIFSYDQNCFKNVKVLLVIADTVVDECELLPPWWHEDCRIWRTDNNWHNIR